MMPGEDGMTLCRDLRKTIETPIMLLTAKGETDDRITGLEAGADDYLAKPFEPKELLLRINAILRRVPQVEATSVAPKVLHMGPVRYDIARGASPGEAMTRTHLVEELSRSGGQTQERAVDVQITRLRRKIEVDPKQPRYLQTVRGAGYMLAPE